MLNRESKIFILSLLFLSFVSSCDKNKNDAVFLEKSINVFGLKEYNNIRNQIYDSIENWNKNQLFYFSDSGLYKLSWKIDTLICFNTKGNKFVTALEKQFNDKGNRESIDIFYGAKINNQWCFFTGAYIVLPREMYQKDVTKPLSFEKLHEIALKEVFSGYLKKKKPIVPFWKFWVKQEYEIDEQYFMKHWNYYGCMQKNNKDEYSQVCSNGMIDSLIMLNVYDNWRDKTERNFMNTKELWEYYYKTKFPL